MSEEVQSTVPIFDLDRELDLLRHGFTEDQFDRVLGEVFSAKLVRFNGTVWEPRHLNGQLWSDKVRDIAARQAFVQLLLQEFTGTDHTWKVNQTLLKDGPKAYTIITSYTMEPNQ